MMDKIKTNQESITRWCLCQLNVMRRVVSYSMGVLWHLSKDQTCRHMVFIYVITFLVILPAICHVMKFSVYYSHPNTKFSQEMMRKENTGRLQMAARYFHMLNRTKLHSMLGKESHNDTAVDVAITIISVSRNRHRIDSYEPKYLTQVVWRFLSQLHDAQAHGFKLHVHLSVCNVDPDPFSYREAQALSHLIPIHNRYRKLTFSMVHPLEKEKQDYVFCLNRSLALNPRYALLVEDDALPRDDFFPVLQHVIRTSLDGRYVRGSFVNHSRPAAYVKMYHPERLLGFISLESERLPELFAIGTLLGTLAAGVYWSVVQGGHRWKVWLCFIVYIILVALAVGRANLVELRRFLSPYLYTIVKAPECCTPAMLFPREGGRQVAAMLQRTVCRNRFGKDAALWKWGKKHHVPAYLVQPNMVTHIGMYSSLRAVLLDPFIV